MRNGASYGWNGERRKVVCVCRVACGAAEERGRSNPLCSGWGWEPSVAVGSVYTFSPLFVHLIIPCLFCMYDSQ